MKKLVAATTKFAKFLGTSYMAAFTGISMSSIAFAQDLDGIGGTSGDLLTFVKQTLNLAITLAALVAVGYLVYSGFQYILAAGDENKIEKATKGIIYSIIGLTVCFISVLIVNFVLERVLKAS